MAAKEAKAGQKRKVAAKGKPDGKAKKARLSDSKPRKMAAKQASRDPEDSDSDDEGGVKLAEELASKASRRPQGTSGPAVFDRGAWRGGSPGGDVGPLTRAQVV